jgi:hypothetical protein
VCYMTCPSHPSSLYHSNYIWRRVQVMNLIMQLSPTSYHFIPLRSKYRYLTVQKKIPVYVYLNFPPAYEYWKYV